MAPSACMLASCRTGCRRPPKSSCLASRGTFPWSAFVDSDILGMLNAPLTFQPLELDVVQWLASGPHVSLDTYMEIKFGIPQMTPKLLPWCFSTHWRRRRGVPIEFHFNTNLKHLTRISVKNFPVSRPPGNYLNISQFVENLVLF